MDQTKILELALNRAVDALVRMIGEGCSKSSIEAQKALVEDTRRRLLEVLFSDL